MSKGSRVETLSIHRADPGDLLADADRLAAATTFSVLPVSPVRLVTAHVAALRARANSIHVDARARAPNGAPGLRDRLWHVFYFAEAMVLVRHCRRTQITHIHAHFADSATDVAMLVAHYQRGARPGGTDMTWSLAVHGSVEFYNVIRYGLAQKLARARFAVAISDFGRSQLMTLTSQERWAHIHVVHCGVDPHIYVPPARRSESDRQRRGPVRREAPSRQGPVAAVRERRSASPRGARRGRHAGRGWTRSSRAGGSRRRARPVAAREFCRCGGTGRDPPLLRARRHLLPPQFRRGHPGGGDGSHGDGVADRDHADHGDSGARRGRRRGPADSPRARRSAHRGASDARALAAGAPAPGRRRAP